MISFFNAVNCYCDASLIKKDGVTVTCSGYVITYQNDVIDTGNRIVAGSTNNYGELMAIYMGTNALLKKVGYDAFLNLFSDSKISIYGLKYWIYSWIRDRDPVTHKLLSSSGQDVANQELFTAIIGLICDVGVNIGLYHQRGHMDINKERDIGIMMHAFKADNGTDITHDIAREVSYYNNLVDNGTREMLKKVVADESFKPEDFAKPMIVLSSNIDMQTMSKYKQLIG